MILLLSEPCLGFPNYLYPSAEILDSSFSHDSWPVVFSRTPVTFSVYADYRYQKNSKWLLKPSVLPSQLP